MFGTHRRRPEKSEVFRAEEPAGDPERVDALPGIPDGEGEIEMAKSFCYDRKGLQRIAMLRAPLSPPPKEPLTNSEEFPTVAPMGAAEKGLVCLRCGKPGHFWRQCPEPSSPILHGDGKGANSGNKGFGKTSSTGKGKNAYLAGVGDFGGLQNNMEEQTGSPCEAPVSEVAPTDPLGGEFNPENSTIDPDPRDAYYAQDATPQAWMAFLNRDGTGATTGLNAESTLGIRHGRKNPTDAVTEKIATNLPPQF